MPSVRIELTTFWLQIRCTTNCAMRACWKYDLWMKMMKEIMMMIEFDRKKCGIDGWCYFWYEKRKVTWNFSKTSINPTSPPLPSTPFQQYPYFQQIKTIRVASSGGRVSALGAESRGFKSLVALFVFLFCVFCILYFVFCLSKQHHFACEIPLISLNAWCLH